MKTIPDVLRNLMLQELLDPNPECFEPDDMLTLEEAGLEEDTRRQPMFGETPHGFVDCPTGGVYEYASWFYEEGIET